MEGLLFFVVMIVVVGLLMAVSHRSEQQRTEACRGLAAELGLEFHAAGNPWIQAEFGHFRLFSLGRRRRVRNLLIGESRGTHVALFGYRYKTSSGKNSSTHNQTVFAIRAKDLELPEFELRPEHLLSKIGQMMGYQDIDFDSHPKFSSHYIVRGKDEASVRAFLTSERLNFLESEEGVSIEAVGDRLVFYRAGIRLHSDELRAFMDEGFRVYAALKTS